MSKSLTLTFLITLLLSVSSLFSQESASDSTENVIEVKRVATTPT